MQHANQDSNSATGSERFKKIGFEELKKSSKHIKKILGAKGFDIPLSTVQEAMAESFGWKSLSMAAPKADGLRKGPNPVIRRLNSPNLIGELLRFFLPQTSDDSMWRARAASMAFAAFDNIPDWRLMRASDLADTLSLASLARRAGESERIRRYLDSLPGFDIAASRQSSTAMEQHGYLAMQFSRPIQILEFVEMSDPHARDCPDPSIGIHAEQVPRDKDRPARFSDAILSLFFLPENSRNLLASAIRESSLASLSIPKDGPVSIE